MRLSKNELIELLAIATKAALKSGEIINEYAHRNIDVKSKNSGDSLASQVVTEVDILCQNSILEIINPTLDKYDLALLTEESTDNGSRLEKDYFWCVDPLDGTLSFVESKPGYSVSIALVSREGISFIGVIYDPFRDKLYTAVKGEGVFLNGEKWIPDLNEYAKDSTLSFYFDRSFRDNGLFDKVLAELNTIGAKLGCNNLIISQYGGAALNAMHILETHPACYFKFPKPTEGGGSLWDYAASACICTEAGTWVTDIYGEALNLNDQKSTFMNERAVIYASDYRIGKEIVGLFQDLTG